MGKPQSLKGGLSIKNGDEHYSLRKAHKYVGSSLAFVISQEDEREKEVGEGWLCV